jgi:predicted nucleic acid-binding protein
VFSSKRLYERALPICAKYGERLSFADSVTVRLMYDEKVHEIASFDSDFDRVENVARVS